MEEANDHDSSKLDEYEKVASTLQTKVDAYELIPGVLTGTINKCVTCLMLMRGKLLGDWTGDSDMLDRCDVVIQSMENSRDRLQKTETSCYCTSCLLNPGAPLPCGHFLCHDCASNVGVDSYNRIYQDGHTHKKYAKRCPLCNITFYQTMRIPVIEPPSSSYSDSSQEESDYHATPRKKPNGRTSNKKTSKGKRGRARSSKLWAHITENTYEKTMYCKHCNYSCPAPKSAPLNTIRLHLKKCHKWEIDNDIIV